MQKGYHSCKRLLLGRLLSVACTLWSKRQRCSGMDSEFLEQELYKLGGCICTETETRTDTCSCYGTFIIRGCSVGNGFPDIKAVLKHWWYWGSSTAAHDVDCTTPGGVMPLASACDDFSMLISFSSQVMADAAGVLTTRRTECPDNSVDGTTPPLDNSGAELGPQ